VPAVHLGKKARRWRKALMEDLGILSNEEFALLIPSPKAGESVTARSIARYEASKRGPPTWYKNSCACLEFGLTEWKWDIDGHIRPARRKKHD
jgi:hypothetical protein